MVSAHRFEPQAGLLRELLARHEDAVGLLAAPSANAAAQLVKLREAESFGRLDHHDGVGYIDADLMTEVATMIFARRS